jgi:hypothetical protein
MPHDPPYPINLTAGATAEAKFEIKAEVPSGSVGRFVDAVTDIFRPFSERRGLLADQIRMQRADVAIEIAKRARAKLAIEEMTANPVPNKILIPLIEKSTNEDPNDDFMIDRWADLLATASSTNDVEPRFIGILGEINGRQAKALDKIARNRWSEFEQPAQHLIDASAYLDIVSTRKYLNSLFAEKRFAPQVHDIQDEMLALLTMPGSAVIDIIAFDEDNSMWSLDSRYLLDLGALRDLDLEILSSLGLLKRVNFFYTSKFKQEFQVIYYHITELGIEFYLCCNRGIKKLADAARTEGQTEK